MQLQRDEISSGRRLAVPAVARSLASNVIAGGPWAGRSNAKDWPQLRINQLQFTHHVISTERKERSDWSEPVPSLSRAQSRGAVEGWRNRPRLMAIPDRRREIPWPLGLWARDHATADRIAFGPMLRTCDPQSPLRNQQRMLSHRGYVDLAGRRGVHASQ